MAIAPPGSPAFEELNSFVDALELDSGVPMQNTSALNSISETQMREEAIEILNRQQVEIPQPVTSLRQRVVSHCEQFWKVWLAYLVYCVLVLVFFYYILPKHIINSGTSKVSHSEKLLLEFLKWCEENKDTISC